MAALDVSTVEYPVPELLPSLVAEVYIVSIALETFMVILLFKNFNGFLKRIWIQ